MTHDDGMKNEDAESADIILLGVSRTSKTPTSIYLANREYKTLNILPVGTQGIPSLLRKDPNKFCIIGLVVEADRLSDIRSNRLEIMKEINIPNYSNLNFVKQEIEESKKLFKIQMACC